MTEKVTVELPEDLARRAHAVAVQTRRRVGEVLVEWINRAAADPPVESLSDEELLALGDAELEEGLQEELSDLLERQQEGAIQGPEGDRLRELMALYRRGLVRKVQAVQAAVAHGLRPWVGATPD
jgi:hypothetical protein